jgi:hypothetical protein
MTRLKINDQPVVEATLYRQPTTKMALAAALASWDEPCTSSFAAWRASEVANVCRVAFISS